jgi:hypothetical protein
MNVTLPPSLLAGVNDRDTIDAIYFTIRTLRNRVRGYTNVRVSTEPASRITDLATKAVQEIEAAENLQVDQIPPFRIQEYIGVLEALMRSKYNALAPGDEQRGAKLLEELRMAG